MYGQPPPGQGPQGPPPPPPVPPAGFPAPPPAKSRSPLLFMAIGLVSILALGMVAVVLVLFQGGGVSGPLQAGHCVDTDFGADAGNRIPASARVDCGDPEAKARVLKVTQERTATLALAVRAEPDCPSGTDGVTNVKTEPEAKKVFEACVRNLKAPHPGDPGAGGALLSVGDCVSGGSIGLGGQEKPCSGDDWYGKVIARVDTEASCPAKTLETMKLRSFGGGRLSRPVLCLGAGGGVLAEGDCIADPSFAIGSLRKADCSASGAVAKVMGRVKTTSECPSTATHSMTAEGAYLPVLCLKQLRPTLSEKLRSLGN